MTGGGAASALNTCSVFNPPSVKAGLGFRWRENAKILQDGPRTLQLLKSNEIGAGRGIKDGSMFRLL